MGWKVRQAYARSRKRGKRDAAARGRQGTPSIAAGMPFHSFHASAHSTHAPIVPVENSRMPTSLRSLAGRCLALAVLCLARRRAGARAGGRSRLAA